MQLNLRVLLSSNCKLFINNMQREPTTILYIDDDQDDLLIFEESVSTLYPDVTLYKAQSSEAGIQILDQLEMENKPFPSLIMIDMNMPKMNGRETLQHIRKHKKWRNIPVAIFTTSANKEDIEFCKSYGSACITKPMSYADFSTTLQKLFNQIIPPGPLKAEEVRIKK
jgi:CheY-like chemotaxis protein